MSLVVSEYPREASRFIVNVIAFLFLLGVTMSETLAALFDFSKTSSSNKGLLFVFMVLLSVQTKILDFTAELDSSSVIRHHWSSYCMNCISDRNFLGEQNVDCHQYLPSVPNISSFFKNLITSVPSKRKCAIYPYLKLIRDFGEQYLLWKFKH